MMPDMTKMLRMALGHEGFLIEAFEAFDGT
jgi:hypothetical protein